jgi:hypothetical protein
MPRHVAQFSFADGVSRGVTDIAIDRWGILWAIGFSDRLVCHPTTGRCEVMGSLPGSYNALGAVRGAVPHADVLVAAATTGNVIRIAFDGTVTPIGHLGAASSGDADHHGDRVYFARAGDGRDELVSFAADDVLMGAPPAGPRREAALASSTTYGLTACHGALVTVDDRGVVRWGEPLDLRDTIDTRIAFWGAACSRPPPPEAAPPETARERDDSGAIEPEPGEGDDQTGRPSAPDATGCLFGAP